MKRLFVRFVAPLALACLTATPVAAQEVVEVAPATAICATTVRMFPYFTSIPGLGHDTSKIAEVTIRGDQTPCNFSFTVSNTNSIDVAYAVGGDATKLCRPVDANTGFCEGFLDTSITIGFGDTLSGSYPSTVRVKSEGAAEVVSEFRGRAMFLPIFRAAN